jgi:hypothetical protein
MLKIANQILDVYDDIDYAMMKKIAGEYPGCNVMSADERSVLRNHQFALTVITKQASKMNKYPIVDHDSTWLSNRYFEMTYQRLPEEAAGIAAYNIKTACAKFKIEPSKMVKSMAKIASSNIYFEKGNTLKSTNVVSMYDFSKLAQVDAIGDNYTQAQYAMPNAAHVKIACDYFEQNAAKMPVESRHKYAAAIQRRSHELGLGVQKGAVSKYASDHYSPMVDAHIRARASLVETRPDMKGLYEKIGSVKKDYTPSQFAQLLHGIDKKAGLDRYYGSHLTNPFNATFASEPDPYAGFRYKSASRELLPDELKNAVTAYHSKIAEHFGPLMADELRKDPVSIFDSLPRDAKEIIVGIIDGQL